MDDKGIGANSLRQFRRGRREKKNFFSILFGAANFIAALGIMIGATGFITFVPFHNLLSKMLLIFGTAIFVFGFFVKVLEVILKILGVRS